MLASRLASAKPKKHAPQRAALHLPVHAAGAELVSRQSSATTRLADAGPGADRTHAASAEQNTSLEPSDLPPDAPRPATGDENFGETSGATPYHFKVLLQNRFRRTAVEVSPELHRLILADVAGSEPLAASFEEQLRNDARENDGLGLQRAFLRADAEVSHSFSIKLLVDFAELLQKNQKRALKQAFGEARISERVAVRAGLLKLPMSLYELLPIASYEFGSSSPVDALIQDLGVGGRDLGAVIDIAPLKKKRYLHVELGAYGGDSNGAENKPGLGLVGGRLTSRPFSHLRLGFDCLYRPRSVSDTSDTGTVYEKYATGATCSADAEFTYRKFGIRAEFLDGKRTDSSVFVDKTKHRFMAAWAIASYRVKLRGKSSLIPALRVEWLDEDRQSDVGGSLLMSAAMNLDFSRNVRLLFDLSRHSVQVGTKTRSTLSLYKPSSTSGVVQLQFKL